MAKVRKERAAQPPLDLSPGHIGTRSAGRRVFSEEEPVFRVRLDREHEIVSLEIDLSPFVSVDELVDALSEVLPMMLKKMRYAFGRGRKEGAK